MNNIRFAEGGGAKPFPLLTVMSNAYDHASHVVRWVYDRRTNTPSTLDPGHYFPNASCFTRRWADIRDEIQPLTIERIPRFHEIMREQTAISAQDGLDWRMFILKAYGISVPENMRRCPILSSILAETPEVMSAAISYLAPRKVIPVHRGPFRGILRFHLSLSMPVWSDGRPSAVLTIDGQDYRLANGESLLWDDTYPHGVTNKSDEVRIALLLDVWRKDMPLDMEILSRLIVMLAQLTMKIRGVSLAG